MKTKPVFISVLSVFFFLSVLVLSCSDNKQAKEEWIDPLEETVEQRDARMEWWRDARFGLFIHWGIYAVPAGTYQGEQIPGIGEWILHRANIPVAEYKSYAKDFNPVNYDPKAWVKMAKDAGMKYIVITSKHHDGFALYDSKVSDWDVVDATPYGKDLLKPLVKAAKKEGLKIGFYYSQAQDWTHPGGAKAGMKEGEYWDEAQAGDFDDYLKNIAYPQVEEILSNYDLDILWWDTPSWMTKERAELLRPLIKLQPGLITNNRLGGGFKGDTDTPEQHIPATGIEGRDWEVCMTMNHTWGYKSYDTDWKSTEDLVRKLVDIASKGGNFLLNVGPRPDGTIPEASVERLAEVGGWMDMYSEAIYETSASPFRRPWWGRCTKKELEDGNTRLYLHIFDWPEDLQLKVPVMNEVVQCYSLADEETGFKTEKEENGLVVKLTGNAPNEICSVIVLDIKGQPDVPDQNTRLNKEGALILKLEEADLENRGYVSSNHARLVSGDGTEYLTWIETNTWLEWPVVLEDETTFDVYATFATSSDSNTLFFQIDKDKQMLDLPDTGGLEIFRKLKIGTITIPAGKTRLVLKGEREGWQPYNLEMLELIPV